MKKISLFIKRLFDIVLSVLGLLIAFPILLVSGILIKISMPGPIFFTQERLGRYGKTFTIYKFRTMKVAPDTHNSSEDKNRITRLGAVLRRLKIDELPQIVNVLIGNMSLIGPRPSFPEHFELYDERQKHRLDMRPGMTGWAQVNGNAALSWEDRIEYDLKYIKNYSLFLDAKIIIKTILVVFLGEKKFTKKLTNTTESKFIYQ